MHKSIHRQRCCVIVLLFGLIGSLPAAGFYAYVCNTGSANVSVVDLATDTVVGSIPTGSGPYAVAVSPSGSRVYTADTYTDSISILDATSRTLIGHVVVGQNPGGIAVTPDGSRVYVAVQGTASVVAIETVNNSVIANIPVESGPHGILVSPDGKRVYAPNHAGYRTSVSVIDTASNAVIGSIGVGVSPMDLAINADGSRLYVMNNQDFTLSVVDTTAGQVGAEISRVFIGHGASGVTLSPDGRNLYTTRAGFMGDDVLVVDTASATVTQVISVGGGPQGILFSPDGTKVYVGRVSANELGVISTATKSLVANIPVGLGPYCFGKFIGPKPPVACESEHEDSGDRESHQKKHERKDQAGQGKEDEDTTRHVGARD